MARSTNPSRLQKWCADGIVPVNVASSLDSVSKMLVKNNPWGSVNSRLRKGTKGKVKLTRLVDEEN